MEYFIAFILLALVGLCVAFVRLSRAVFIDRRIIFTELMEARHRHNQLCNSMSEYIHSEMEHRREQRELTTDEKEMWEKSREAMRRFVVEKQKYDTLYK